MAWKPPRTCYRPAATRRQVPTSGQTSSASWPGVASSSADGRRSCFARCPTRRSSAIPWPDTSSSSRVSGRPAGDPRVHRPCDNPYTIPLNVSRIARTLPSLNRVAALQPSLSPGGRRCAYHRLERPAEGRLGVIADVERDGGHLRRVVAEQPARKLDAPSREIAHRRLPDQRAETFGQRRSRHADRSGKPFERPRIRWPIVQQRQRVPGNRITQSGQPSRLLAG